ncbi:MAG: phage portal protein [Ignavibacteriales bacterium]|nr:phage portal protein [Ignavibacteriales bacterium]
MGLITESYLRQVEEGELQRLTDYLKYETYYNNKQTLTIPEKFKSELSNMGIRTNYIAPIIDSFVSKLKVKGFSAGGAAEKIEDVWNQNRMDALRYKIHRITAKKGDCYVIVWPDQDGNVQIKVISPEFMTPVPDPEDEEKILYYKKQWNIVVNDKVITRKDVFYPDRIERYVSSENSEWQPYEGDSFPSVFENKFKMIPVVHFRNKIDEGIFGISEIRDAIPIQDDINRTIMDMLLDAGYLGFGQIFIAGVTKTDIELNNPNGLDRNPGSGWIFPNENTKVDKLQAEPLTSFIEAIDAQVNHLATVTRTPLFYLKATSQPTAGVTLRELEGPFLDKVCEAQISFGNCYEDINRLILKELGMNEEPTTIIWESVPLTAEEVRNDITMHASGLLSRKQVLRRQGYDSNEIEEIIKEIDEEEKLPQDY